MLLDYIEMWVEEFMSRLCLVVMALLVRVKRFKNDLLLCRLDLSSSRWVGSILTSILIRLVLWVISCTIDDVQELYICAIRLSVFDWLGGLVLNGIALVRYQSTIALNHGLRHGWFSSVMLLMLLVSVFLSSFLLLIDPRVVDDV